MIFLYQHPKKSELVQGFCYNVPKKLVNQSSFRFFNPWNLRCLVTIFETSECEPSFEPGKCNEGIEQCNKMIIYRLYHKL